MIKKKYLTEVVFKNGVDEFRAYSTFHQTKKVEIEEEMTDSYRILLDYLEIDTETLTVEIQDRYETNLLWRRINGEHGGIIEVYTEGTDAIKKGDTIEISYTALKEASSDLYSVDYETGTLYLANKTNVDLTCTCQFYNIFLTGKAAAQLEADDYTVASGNVLLKNNTESSSYAAIYKTKVKEEDEYTTPFLRNLKVNYLNTSEEESLR